MMITPSNLITALPGVLLRLWTRTCAGALIFFMLCSSVGAVVAAEPVPSAPKPPELPVLIAPKVAIAANTDSDPHGEDDLPLVLTPLSRQIVRELNITPLILRLHAIKQQLREKPDLGLEVERLKLKEEISDAILEATLQVRDVTARIDRQIAYHNRLQGYLEGKRDKAVLLNSMANAFGMGAVNEIGQVGELGPNEIPGEITQVVASALTMVLSALAIKQQSGGKRVEASNPNMLAKLFGAPTDANSEYPHLVWTYLNSASPDSPGRSRREQLLSRWKTFGIIDDDKKPATKRRIDLLTNSSPKQVYTIDLLTDQNALLEDVKSEVFQLDRDLLGLLNNLRAL